MNDKRWNNKWSRKKRKLTYRITKNNCWKVISHKPDNSGYPRISGDKGQERAHRFMWRKTYGPIPKGLLVCHHCDNTLCINPEHLFIGTDYDNVQDRQRKGRTVVPDNHRRKHINHNIGKRNTKLTKNNIYQIKKLLKKGYPQYAIATKFNVCRHTICRAMKRGV